MFKTTILINQETNIDDLINMLLKKVANSTMDSEQSSSLEEQFRLQVEPILNRGKDLHSNGSQLNIDTTVKAEGYEISVRGNFGTKGSFWKRLFGKK